MMQREPIFHDRQNLQLDGPLTTSNDEFEDIPGAVLTTKDLGQPGTYQFTLSMELQQTNNNTTIEVRACINGVPSMSRPVHFGPNSAGDPQGATIVGGGSGIAADSEVQIQWSTTGGTAQLNDLEMIMDGIPDIRVIE